MNRTIFLTLFVIISIAGYTALKLDIEHNFIIYLTVMSIVFILRRRYLKLKPWWGGKLMDIPKYFQKP